MLDGGPFGVLVGGPFGVLVGGPSEECPLGMLDGGPFGVLVGGPFGDCPSGVLVGGPFGVLVGGPLGVVVADGDGATVAQNWATVSPFALASSVSWGKLFWALPEALLVLVPLVAAAQAVHSPKAFGSRAGALLFCPPAWLFEVAAPPLAGGEAWLFGVAAPPLAGGVELLGFDEGWLSGFGTEIPTSRRAPDTADWTGPGSAPAAAAAAPPPSTAAAPTAAIAAVLIDSQLVSIRFLAP
jgi:hypothetical protein